MDIKSKLTSLLDQADNARMSNLDHSIQLARAVLSFCKGKADTDIKARAMSQLSLYHMIIGDNEIALNYAQQSMKLFETLGDEKGIADAKYTIASVYYKTDNYHIGIVFLIDALSTYKKFDDQYNISRCEKSLGTIYEYSGDQKSAVKAYERAIAAARKVKNINLESNVYNNLSGVYIKQKKIEQASEIIEKSVVLKTKTGDVRGLGFALYGRGKVLAAQGDYENAEAEFFRAIEIHMQMGDRLGLAMAYYKLAKLYMGVNHLADAKVKLHDAVALTEKYNISIIKFKCYYLFYLIYKQENQQQVALGYLERYLNEKEHVLNAQTLKVIESYDMLVQMKTIQREAELQKQRAEIIEKTARAEESARVRQEFLSTMSHEIRTPLNAITTIVSMLSERPGEDEKLISSLKFSSNLLMWIINDILDFTKLDLGKMSLEPHPVKLRALLDNIWQSYNYQANEKGLELVLDTKIPASATYQIDQTRLTQVLGNLVNNAIKFTASGQIDLQVSVAKKGRLHDVLSFRVADTGQGIESKNLESIFDSFSQLKNTTTRKERGTGLGLAIVKSLVKLHKSDIAVSSTPGKGTVFTFLLKLKKANDFTEKNQQPATAPLEGKKVLLAEDNAINAMIAMKLLRQWGIVADHAKNGTEAVAKSNNAAFDFILMDIHMPEMDGFDAASTIRKGKSSNKTTPIYALTADISAKDNENYNKLFNGFLHKPLEIDKLYEALRGAGH